jgi:cardiolipin synthase (CMP-forming)
VVSRDIMIVGAVIVSWLFGKPVPMKPLMVSKLNTASQVAFAALVLGSVGFGFNISPYDLVLMGLITIFTLLSVSFYLVEWARHMSTIETR